MKASRNVFWAVAVCATLAIAGTGYESAVWAGNDSPGAWHRHSHHEIGGGFDGAFGAALKQLDLSDAQQQSIHSIFNAAHPSMQAGHADTHGALQAFATALPDDPNYPQLLADAIRESQQFAAQRVQHLSDIRTQLYAVLTPEQKKKLPGLLAEIDSKRQQMWQQHRQQHSEPVDGT
jgi:Spy/CpxP family protein refolding chaperone